MLLHGRSENRTLTIIGALSLLVIVVAITLVVVNPFAGRGPGLITVTIDTPFVGQGVTDGTPAVLHGVEIGKVTRVANTGGGGARLDIDMEEAPIAELTDTMQVDFRPINYFGVSGINIVPGTGGAALRDGMQISVAPKGNFTLQSLLSRLGEVSTGVLTPQLIQVIDRATRYTDALNPLLETLLIAGDAVAQVQTISTAQLLTNATGLSVAFPSTSDGMIEAVNTFLHNNRNFNNKGSGDVTQEEWDDKYVAVLEEGSVNLFRTMGTLESSHVDDLLPVVNSITALTDVVPTILRPDGFAQTLGELRSRFEKMYAGSPEQRALQVRIVLHEFPGVAAPLGVMGRP